MPALQSFPPSLGWLTSFLIPCASVPISQSLFAAPHPGPCVGGGWGQSGEKGNLNGADTGLGNGAAEGPAGRMVPGVTLALPGVPSSCLLFWCLLFKALFHPVTNLFCVCHSQPSCLLYHHSSNRDSGSREKSGWAPPCISAVWHHLSPSCLPFPGFHIPSLCPDQPPFMGSLLSPPRPLPLVAIGADSRHGRLLHHHRLHQVRHRPPAPPRGLEPIISSNLTRTIPPTILSVQWTSQKQAHKPFRPVTPSTSWAEPRLSWGQLS